MINLFGALRYFFYIHIVLMNDGVQGRGVTTFGPHTSRDKIGLLEQHFILVNSYDLFKSPAPSDCRGSTARVGS